jgi:hypothetical protein
LAERNPADGCGSRRKKIAATEAFHGASLVKGRPSRACLYQKRHR